MNQEANPKDQVANLMNQVTKKTNWEAYPISQKAPLTDQAANKMNPEASKILFFAT